MSAIAVDTPQTRLRRRIGWLCHLTRWAALAYAAWILVVVLQVWGEEGRAASIYGAWLKADLSGMQNWQRVAGLGLSLAIWSLTAITCYGVWRLFTGYLAGSIFTREAALWLRRIALFGLCAQGADILVRPLVSMIVSAHLPAGHRLVGIALNPQDLLTLLFLLGFLALGHVFTAATEIADENAQFV
ncbi:DUF2975 domain-containing protein [Bosea sp. NPDC055332]